MKKIVLILISMVLLSSCRKEINQTYILACYKDGQPFIEVFEYGSDSFSIKSFYASGAIERIIVGKGNPNLSVEKNVYTELELLNLLGSDGLIYSFYPDGFGKERCLQIDSNYVSLNDFDKNNKFEMNIDFGDYITAQDGNLCRTFRFFIDGIPLSKVQLVFPSKDDSSFIIPQLMPFNIKYSDIMLGMKDSFPILRLGVDETNYPYLMPNLSQIIRYSDEGIPFFIVDLFYSDRLCFDASNEWYIPNESRIVIIHDSLNWEVKNRDISLNEGVFNTMYKVDDF